MQEINKKAIDLIAIAKDNIKLCVNCDWMHPIQRESFIETMKKDIEQSKKIINLMRKLNKHE
jgi:hypothetical protein